MADISHGGGVESLEQTHSGFHPQTLTERRGSNGARAFVHQIRRPLSNSLPPVITQLRPGETAQSLMTSRLCGLVAGVAILATHWIHNDVHAITLIVILAWVAMIAGLTAIIFRLFETTRRRSLLEYGFRLLGATCAVALLVSLPVLPASTPLAAVSLIAFVSSAAVGMIAVHFIDSNETIVDRERVTFDDLSNMNSVQTKSLAVSFDPVHRALDILGSIIMLVITVPLMAGIAIAIKVDSPGPILYSQRRVGLRGTTFVFRKFRSMIVDAEPDGVPQWAQENDQRVTRVGRIIRRSRLDELPQLFDVLLGRMSLVGPRPERVEFVDELRRCLPGYDVRHQVRPGLTGWAQIRYQYAASRDETALKLEYDLFYVAQRSPLFDMKIAVDTIPVVLFGMGAR